MHMVTIGKLGLIDVVYKFFILLYTNKLEHTRTENKTSYIFHIAIEVSTINAYLGFIELGWKTNKGKL